MHSCKILVVDDEAVFVDMCRSTLGNLGYNVFCTHTGEQAVELAEKIHFDLAVINRRLAGVDGIETLVMLRQIEPNISGLLVTDHADLHMVIDAMNKGFSGIIEKAGDSGKLISSVQEALAVARLREENTRLRTLLPLYKLGRKFLATTSAEKVYTELVAAIHQEIQVPCISVMIPDQSSGQLKIVASYGLASSVVDKIRVNPGEKVAGWVYARGEPVILNRRTQGNTLFSKFLKRHEIAAAISYPLAIRDKIVGVVNISQADTRVEYSQADIELLSVICDQAAIALESVFSFEERERLLRLRTLFEQYVAPEVAELLLRQKENLLEVGEVKKLTVLFADIRNFTSLVQHIPPEEIRLFLNQFFELFANAVFASQGTLDKFMGDAVLVMFGAPVTIAKPARAAVETAIQIVLAFAKLQQEWVDKSEWFENIGIGIGISCGDMFLGNVGSRRRLDYTVIGTDVNVAQRLAAETESGQILITESVYEEVAGAFEVIKEKPRRLRGLEQMIQLYSVRTASTNH